MTRPVPVVILGAAGDARVVAETVRSCEAHGQPVALRGYLDDALVGQQVDGSPVLGGLRDWGRLDPETRFVLALHKVRQMHRRQALVESLAIPMERWTVIAHPTAVIARDARIRAGAFLAAHVVVQPSAAIGHCATIRAGANIGHDAACGDFSYVGPNATLCGKAVLGKGAHLGPNSVIVDGMVVEEFSVIGAGSVATKRVPSFEVHFGVPAKKVLDIK